MQEKPPRIPHGRMFQQEVIFFPNLTKPPKLQGNVWKYNRILIFV